MPLIISPALWKLLLSRLDTDRSALLLLFAMAPSLSLSFSLSFSADFEWKNMLQEWRIRCRCQIEAGKKMVYTWTENDINPTL
jgi:hypothetical protein